MPLRLIPRASFQEILGAALGRFRLEAALDQAAMAKTLGMSAANLSRIENGHGNLTVEQLFYACQILDIPPSRYIELVEAVQKAMKAEGITIMFTHATQDVRRSERGYIQIARDAIRESIERVARLHVEISPGVLQEK